MTYNNNYDGVFVVLEGINNAGKTTAAEAIDSWSNSRPDLEIRTTAEPYGDVANRPAPASAAWQFALDRHRHLEEVIKPALGRGGIVVCDRYVGSSLAYQGSQCSTDIVEDINSVFPEPDLTIYIDVPTHVALERGDGDCNEETLRAAKDVYEELYGPCDPDVRIIDGTVSAAHTRHVAVNAVKGLVTEEIRESGEESKTYVDAVEEIRNHIEENEDDYRKMGDV